VPTKTARTVPDARTPSLALSGAAKISKFARADWETKSGHPLSEGRRRETLKLFGQIVRTVVNVVELPVAVAKDVVTLGGIVTEQGKSYTKQQLEKIADEAQED